jgi:hypothetical protein
VNEQGRLLKKNEFQNHIQSAERSFTAIRGKNDSLLFMLLVAIVWIGDAGVMCIIIIIHETRLGTQAFVIA